MAKQILAGLYMFTCGSSLRVLKSYCKEKLFLDPGINNVRNDQFKKTKNLFLAFYPDYLAQHDIVNLVMLPPERIDILYPFDVRSIISSQPKYSTPDTADRVSSELVYNITRNYMDAVPVFILSKGGDIGNIYTNVDEFVSRNSDDKYYDIKDGYRKIRTIVENGLFLEILMSGHPYLNQVFSTLVSGGAFHNKAIAALKSNSVLSKNAVNYIILAEHDSTVLNGFKDDYYSYIVNRANPDSVNVILGRMNARWMQNGHMFRFAKSDNSADPNLYLEYRKEGTVLWKDLVPNPELIIDRQMVFTQSYYTFAQLKDKVETALFDMSLMDDMNITSENKEILKLLTLNAATND